MTENRSSKTGAVISEQAQMNNGVQTGTWLVSYQRKYRGEVSLTAANGDLDDIIASVKEGCDQGGMAWVYYAMTSGMLQLVHVEGQIEDLFR